MGKTLFLNFPLISSSDFELAQLKHSQHQVMSFSGPCGSTYTAALMWLLVHSHT